MSHAIFEEYFIRMLLSVVVFVESHYKIPEI